MLRQAFVVVCLVFLGLANALSIEKRIVNGVPADIYDFPSIGSLQYLGRHICGAVLVNRTKVLTAAHCTEGFTAATLRVVFGAINIKDPAEATPYQQSRSVASYVMHKQYNSHRTDLPNDIAMITLATPVDLNPNVQLATLATPGSSFSYQTCKIAGWGMTSIDSTGAATYLKKANITKIPNDECLRLWGSSINPTHICVFEQDQSGGNAPTACMGDSGGPLYCGSDLKIVAGLTSWGEQYCSGRYPAVYTRVSEYIDWILYHLV